jgi:flagellar motor switch protein FliM
MVEQATKSQNDIENNSGTTTVKVYDFKKALRLSMEHIRGLAKIHENFAYRLSSTLSGQLRTIVQVDLDNVEQLPYEEFIQQLPSSTVLSVLESEAGHEFRMALNIDPLFAFNMMDRLLGGKGNYKEAPKDTLSSIEINVLKGLLEVFTQNIHKAWAEIAQFKLAIKDIKTNPKFLQLTAPEEMMVIIHFTVLIADRVEKMKLCIPYVFVEPLNAKLLSYNLYGNGQGVKKSERNVDIQEKIEHLTVPVCVELGRSTISIEEFLGLAVNDVIQLDQLADEPLKVKINEQVKFLAHPGTKKSRMAVKIDHVLEGEDHHE